MRTAATNEALTRTLSPARLATYLAAAHQDLDVALALYERNTRLAEAFYTALQAVEVCLRNRLSEQLEIKYGDEWFRPGKSPLDPDAVAGIVKAIQQLHFDTKPVSPGAVIAELGFGFWVSLLAPRYDATLWRRAFFHAFIVGGKPLARDTVHRRLNVIRRFRNRIAHHEPVFGQDLQLKHSEIIESIKWMCVHTADWTAFHSRFLAVFHEDTKPAAGS